MTAFFLNMHLCPWRLHKWRSHHLSAHPPSSCTHTDFLPTPQMHMSFHMAFPLQVLFPFPGMTRRPPSSFMMGSLPLTLGQASVQPFPWLLFPCFLVCPQQDNRAQNSGGNDGPHCIYPRTQEQTGSPGTRVLSLDSRSRHRRCPPTTGFGGPGTPGSR